MVRDRKFRITDVLLATTAAPTFFPHSQISAGDAYVDGGVWANNPSIAAIAESFRIKAKGSEYFRDRAIDIHNMRLLSIGTGKNALYEEPPAAGAGLLWWGPKLFTVSSIAQAQGTQFQAQHMLREGLTRIDYDLPNGTWKLDNVGVVEQLLAIGKKTIAETINVLRGEFFDSQKHFPYQPFEDLKPAGSERGASVGDPQGD
jgi:hypothetical protein